MSRSSAAPVLVTGAAGFIGANLVRTLLGRGHDVLALVRPSSDLWRLRGLEGRLRLLPVDLRDPAAARQVGACGATIVIHAAAPAGHPAPAGEGRFVEEAVAITTSVMEAACAVGARRLVHVGSSLEYGSHDRPHSEADPLRPDSGRGRAKTAEAEVVQRFVEARGLPAVLARVFSAYGPWESARRLVPTVLRRILDGLPIALTPPGPRHDLVHVHDVSEGLLRLALRDIAPGTVLNLGSGRQWTNAEVAQAAMEVAGRNVPLLVGDYPQRAHDTACWVADCSRARSLLGWTAKHSLRDGLRSTLEWLRAFGHLDPAAV